MSKAFENKIAIRKNDYQKNPNCCQQCGYKFSYEKRKNKFCSNSCSAQFNNSRRSSRNDISRIRTSIAMKNFHKRNEELGIKKQPKIKPYCVILFKICNTCKKLFATSYAKGNGGRKTCSDVCKIVASTCNRSYQNGSRKPQFYFNQNENKNILLESSWEVSIAKQLDSKQIIWLRPDPIEWVDSNKKTRYYYPDFYLPKFNVFLDPKNPYCMEKDIEKMKNVQLKINIIFGDLQIIQNYIETLT